MAANDIGETTDTRVTGFRRPFHAFHAWLRPSTHASNDSIFVRFCKYTVLLFGVIITLKIVFDAYSFYVARRDLDSELRSKKVSSLEYLNVLSQRQRALAITTLEARCLQRIELTLFRIFDAAEFDRIEKVYTELLEQKNRMRDIIKNSGKDLIDVDKATAYIDHPYFQLSKFDDYLTPLNNKAATNPAYLKLRKDFEEEKAKYVAIAVANLPIREQLARANDHFQNEVYKAWIDLKDSIGAAIKESGNKLVDVDRAVRYIDSPEFVLSKIDEYLKPLDKQAETNDTYKNLLLEIKSHKGKFIETAKKYELPNEVEKLIQTKQPPPPMYWNLDAIKIVIERIDQARQQQKETKEKIGDLDDLIARYAVWTGALTGGAIDNPVLDDVAFQIGKDDPRTLKEQNCKRFGDYYAAINAKILDADPAQGKSFGKLTWRESLTSFWAQYNNFLLGYFKQPPAAQTLFVTLLLGALGALTLNLLRMSTVGWWEDQKYPLWGEIIVGPMLGALAAFGIFLVGNAGLLLTGETNGAQAPSAYFIGLLGFLSGLMYDEAFGQVRRVGLRMFSAKPTEEASNARVEDRSLADILKGNSASLAAGLVVKYGLGTRLNLESEFTLLIPSDEAIGNIPLTTWTALNDPEGEVFEKWYKRHHSVKRVNKANVAGTSTVAAVTSLSVDDGTSYALTLDGGDLKINNVRVMIADVIWEKGVIHILSAELT
jgi:uncharacterized surface protein with fasciclin (FAS1) repeats